MALLRGSIVNLNSKFDKFNDNISSKITTIEQNYQDLNAKIDNLAVRPDLKKTGTFGTAH